MKRQHQRRWSRLAALLLAMIMPVLGLFAIPATGHAQDRERCFAETGYCVSGRFLQYWEANGGLPVLGYPITEARQQTIGGKSLLVQWFERQRLELHPENGYPYDVLLGRLGAEQANLTEPTPAVNPKPGCRYFPETGHNVCGNFKALWERFGLAGVAEPDNHVGLWGLPMSEETTILTPDGATRRFQVFERYSFLEYKEYAGDPDWEVQTLPLGSYRICGVNGPCKPGPHK